MQRRKGCGYSTHRIGSLPWSCRGTLCGMFLSSGKPAMSKVCVLERLAHQNQTLVQVEIHSGRPHQIRIHLAYIGHPLVDDPLYCIGGQPKFHDLESTSTDISFAYDGGYERPLQPVPGDCGYHLHAHWLVLSHPTTNKMLKITAPLPHILQTREERCDPQVDT
uniref:Pseudouridine synthase RsuA/RluA-like domain-containing protein n=1 Tax=Aegilops tauschii subsp. strangulata TaxID=200361 RepID=A0A453IBH1_AEGTS